MRVGGGLWPWQRQAGRTCRCVCGGQCVWGMHVVVGGADEEEKQEKVEVGVAGAEDVMWLVLRI